jgi:hypothetical protein
MAFSKALYYPTIDIEKENWLKSAILYWDEIQTIVPTSIKNPYQNELTQILYEKGVLRPFEINPEHALVEDLFPIVMKYIDDSPAAKESWRF